MKSFDSRRGKSYQPGKQRISIVERRRDAFGCQYMAPGDEQKRDPARNIPFVLGTNVRVGSAFPEATSGNL